MLPNESADELLARWGIIRDLSLLPSCPSAQTPEASRYHRVRAAVVAQSPGISARASLYLPPWHKKVVSTVVKLAGDSSSTASKSDISDEELARSLKAEWDAEERALIEVSVAAPSVFRVCVSFWCCACAHGLGYLRQGAGPGARGPWGSLRFC